MTVQMQQAGLQQPPGAQAGQQQPEAGQQQPEACQQQLQQLEQAGEQELQQLLQAMLAGQQQMLAGQQQMLAGQQQLQLDLQQLLAGDQQLQEGLQQLQSGGQQLLAGQQKLESGLQQLSTNLVPTRVVSARAHNETIVDNRSSLVAVPITVPGLTYGHVRAGFPQTRAALRRMAGPALSAMLHSYGIQSIAHSVEGQRQELAEHINVRLPRS